MLLILTLVLLALVAWLYLRWVKVRGYWAERGIPHLPPHPIMGSLDYLQKQNTNLWLRDMYNKLKSPYVGLWLFWRPALLVNTPEVARRILVKDADIFRNRFLSSGSSDPLGGLNLFTVNDPTWTHVRRRITTVFTSAKLKTFFSLVSEKSHKLIKRIKRDGAQKKPISVRPMFSDFTTDIIGTTAFGVYSDATESGESPVRSITYDLMSFTLFRSLSWCSIFFFPELVNTFRFTFFPKSSMRYFRKVFNAVVQRRGGLDANVSEVKDLVDALLKMRSDAKKDGEDMTEDILVSQAAIFLLAGFDTTAVALTFTNAQLAWNPDCQERLYQELKEAKEKNGGKDLDGTQLANLPYLNSVSKESLRLYSPMGWMDRVAATDYKIDDKLTVPAGMPIYINAGAMQRDPEYFPEPNKFNPDRFMPENEKNIPAYTYLPFGDGPRMCIGTRFAQMVSRYALYHIFLNFKVSVPPGAPHPEDIQIDKRAMFVIPDEDVMLIYEPRE